DRDHRVPILLLQLPDRRDPPEAGIVDQDVDAAEAVERGFEHGLGLLRPRHAAERGNRLAAFAPDLRDHALRRIRVTAVQIVDDDARAAPSELDRLGLADAVAGPGDDRHLIFEAPESLGHHRSPCSNTSIKRCPYSTIPFRSALAL